MPYREKRILSGRYLEIEIYPVTLQDTKMNRKEKRKETKPKQQNLNDKNAKKHLTRLQSYIYNRAADLRPYSYPAMSSPRPSQLPTARP